MFNSLPPFPAPAAAPPARPPAGLTLRPASPADLPFFAQIHAETRAADIAPLPWPAAQKLAFLQEQFRLQHLHYVRAFAGADFWALGHAKRGALGRLYLDRSGPEWRIIDVLLASGAQGSGTGTALLRWIQAQAGKAGAKGVALSVETGNPRARALYHRLGFVDRVSLTGTYHAMFWRP